jgi:hypothetical protein
MVEIKSVWRLYNINLYYYYFNLVVKIIDFKGYEYTLSKIILTILISVFAYGMTAVPFCKMYKKRSE